MAITTATATCRSTCSAAAICWPPSCGRRAWTRRRVRWRRCSYSAGAPTAALRGTSLMAWCEANGVHFLFGLAKNDRLIDEIAGELAQAEAKSRRTGKPARSFKDFMWTTRRSWSRRRRVVGKAEFTKDEANPRFVVTSLTRAECKPKYLYEKLYCARGEMENRIKECQLDLYADRTSTAMMPAPRLSPTCCSVPCAGSGCITRHLPRQAAAPFVSSCSRSARSCVSASAASKSRWRRAVPVKNGRCAAVAARGGGHAEMERERLPGSDRSSSEPLQFTAVVAATHTCG